MMHSFLPWLVNSGAVPSDTASVLDLGCGQGVAGAVIRAARPVHRLVGVDAHPPYLEAARACGYQLLVRMDLSKSPLPFVDDEFDLVLALEVVEHLPKADGLRLLDQAERMGRVVVSTPRGMFHQDPYDGNPYQRHLSAWSERDFSARGYDVWYVVRGGGRAKLDMITRSKVLALISSKAMRGSVQLLAVRPKGGNGR